MKIKNLLILRHGQAANGLRDIDRPLTEQGRVDVQRVGGWLRQQGVLPEVVIASSAQRTTETAQLCCAAAGVDANIIDRKRSLYHADCDGWLAELASLAEGINTVLLIGHNPTLSWLVSQLSGAQISLAPANLVHFTVGDDGWNGAVQLAQVILPKNLVQ